MKIWLTHFVILCAATLVFTSCLSTDEEEYTFYDDAAITAFSVSSINVHSYVKDKEGEDSLVITKETGSDYKFYIDNIGGNIYNPDSLPYGTDAKHILVNISTKNGGFVRIKPTDSDNLEDYTYYINTDSLDFSEARVMRVYSQSGVNVRTYNVKVNIHQEVGDTLLWHDAPAETAFTGFTAMRSVVCGDKVLVFGTDGTATKVYATERNNGTAWSNTGAAFGADAYSNVVVKGDRMYLIDGTTLCSSTSGNTWDYSTPADLPARLVGASTKELYGISADGKLMASRDNGASWTAEELDEDAALLPGSEINYTCQPMATGKDMETVMIVGNNIAGNMTTAWTKIVDNSSLNSKDYPWTFVDSAGDTRYALPVLGNLSVFSYDGNAVAFGTKADKTPNTILVSRDNGITWKADKEYYFPKGFNGGVACTATVDADNVIWLVDGNSGKVWKGRINRLGWKEDNKVFLE